jgi:hypothetical protein
LNRNGSGSTLSAPESFGFSAARMHMHSTRVLVVPVIVMLISVAANGCDLSTGPAMQLGVDSSAGTLIGAPVPWYATLPYAAQNATWSSDGSRLLVTSGVVAAGGQGTSVFSIAVPSQTVNKTLTVGGITHSIACGVQTTDCLVGLPDGRILRIGETGDTTTMLFGVTADFIASTNGRFVAHYEEVATSVTLVLVDIVAGSRVVVPKYPLSFICAVAPDGSELDVCGTSIVVRAPTGGQPEQHIAPPDHPGWTPDGIRAMQWTASGLNALVGWDSAGIRQRFYEYETSSGTETLLGEVPYTLYTQAAWTSMQHRAIVAYPSGCLFVNQATQCLLVQFEFSLLDRGTAMRVARSPGAILASLTISPTGTFAAYGLYALGNSAMYIKALP